MKHVCSNQDCPRYYLCQQADVVMEPALSLNYKTLCNSENGYAYFVRNDRTLKELNELMLVVTARYKKQTDRIKAAMDLIMQEERAID